MVTPTNGTLKLRGLQTGQAYSWNMYISDVAAAPVTFSKTALAVAGSPTSFIAPENCKIEDVSIKTGPTVVFVVLPQSNDTPTGQVISIADCLNTLTQRSFPDMGFVGGRRITLVQA